MKYKYIDAEKLIAEIEKRAKFHDDAMKACVGLNNIAITHSAGWKEDTELLAIITSLQQEQPEVEINLGNEVENFCLEYDARKDAWYNMTPRDQKLLSNPTWLNFATNIASHFYELGLNARKEESVSVAESPSKTFPRVNEFDCGGSYRH